MATNRGAAAPSSASMRTSVAGMTAGAQEQHADYVVLGKSINTRQSPDGELTLRGDRRDITARHGRDVALERFSALFAEVTD